MVVVAMMLGLKAEVHALECLVSGRRECFVEFERLWGREYFW